MVWVVWVVNRVSTGLGVVDGRLDGGVPPGAIVTVESEARTQAELFVHGLLSGEPAAFVSTVGDSGVVDAQFRKSPVDVGDVIVEYAPPGSSLEDVRSFISEEVGGEGSGGVSVVVVSSVSDFERGVDDGVVGRCEFRRFLNEVQALQRRTGVVLVLHRFASVESEAKAVTDTFSDIVFEFSEVVDGTVTRDFLGMPKCRSAKPFCERLKIAFREGVRVDTSRDIA